MKRLKIWDWVSTAIFLLGAILFCVSCIETGKFNAPLTLIGIVLVLLGIVISIIKQRCPFCKHYLGCFFDPKKEYCPYCGSKIDSN